jgi:thioesterase domain-containing protein
MLGKVLLLPDFVGHPFCFQKLIPMIKEICECKAINYNDFWPYEDIPSLTLDVKTSLGAWVPDVIVGYSYGGLIGFEVNILLHRASRVMMIDSHLSNDREPCNVDWMSAPLADLLPSRVVELIDGLTDMGEVDGQCVRKNLALFPGYRPRQREQQGQLTFIHCIGPEWESDPAASWRPYFDSVNVIGFRVSHEDIILLKSTTFMISHLVKETIWKG